MTMELTLSSHLAGISAVRLDARKTTESLARQMQRFGPVQVQSFKTSSEAFDFLLPLKSFGSRYVVIGFEEWTILTCDMRLQPCFVEAINITEAVNCEGVTAVFTDEFRQFIAYRGGRDTRAVSCYKEGKWVFYQHGPPLKVERIERLSARRLKERLLPVDVVAMFQATTGISLPLSTANLTGRSFHGVTRSVKGSQVETVNFPTLQDLG